MKAAPLHAFGSRADGDARVLVFSERNLEAPKWQLTQYEFEDVISAVDDVDLLAPGPAGSHRRMPLARPFSEAMRRPVVPTFPRVRIERDYDLFFAVFHFPADIAHLHRLEGWRRRSAKAICFLLELWPHQVALNERYLRLLHDFDAVFLYNPRSVELVREVAATRLEFMPTGVDAFRFSPVTHPAPRSIDVLSIGRRSPYVHEQLLDLTRSSDVFYHYDTSFDVPLVDWREHRELIAHLVKRARYFLAFAASADLERARGVEALAPRYFEGTAGGAVLLGSAPASPEWDECFWEDAVIPFPYRPDDVGASIAELERDPERLVRARRRNAVNSLLRHDWAYRWQRILELAGLEARPALVERHERLRQLAAAGDKLASNPAFGSAREGRQATTVRRPS